MPKTEAKPIASKKIVKIPPTLLKQFQGEHLQLIPELKNGILLLPDSILKHLDAEVLRKNGLAVVLASQKDIIG